jgi:hypothetical protein
MTRKLRHFVLFALLGVVVCVVWILAFYKAASSSILDLMAVLCPGLLIQLVLPLEAIGIWVALANILAVVANGFVYGLGGLVVERLGQPRGS